MNSEITRFLSDHVRAFAQALERLDRQIDPASEPLCEATLDELTQCINNSLRACGDLEKRLVAEEPAALKEAQSQYREAILPWLCKSWIMQRSVTKPRGYAGDYELLTAIYDGVSKSPGFGGYVDRYLLNLMLGRAVPARMWAARRFLMQELAARHGQVSVLNVACGPCREYLGGFEPSPDRRTTFTCVDNDPAALEFAQSQTAAILANSGITAQFVRHNALRMVSASNIIRRFGRSDLIYSVGLCDYIPDEYLIPMLRAWRESVKDGGVVYVAFKDSRLYDTAEYQWLMDWYFFQRTEEACRQLFVEAGYDMNHMATTRDATGVIINFIGRVKAGDALRIDGAETVPLPQHVDDIPHPAPGQAAPSS